jgi:hypothetical protein
MRCSDYLCDMSEVEEETRERVVEEATPRDNSYTWQLSMQVKSG